MQPLTVQRERPRVMIDGFVQTAGLCEPVAFTLGSRRLENREILPGEIVIRNDLNRPFVPVDRLVFTSGIRERNCEVVRGYVVARIEINRARPQRDRVVPVPGTDATSARQASP